MNWFKKDGNRLSLKERMSARKEGVLLRVDTHAEIAGESLGSITPLVAQATSAITVGYATFEGVSRYTHAHPYIAIAAGIISAVAIEGIGYIAVSERDKAQAHNRRTADPSKHIDTTRADNYVTQSFWAAMALVAGFETVPSVYRAFVGEGDAMGVLFGLCLLLFPVLSRLGAQLLAFRMVRESVDTTADDLELRRLKLQLEKEELLAKHEAKVDKIRGKNSPTSGKISPNASPNFMANPHEFAGFPDENSVSNEKNGERSSEKFGELSAEGNAAKRRKIEERYNAICDLIGIYGTMSAPELKDKLLADRGIKASEDTIRDDCNTLVDAGRLVRDGRKWSTPQALVVLPESVGFSTNGHGGH